MKRDFYETLKALCDRVGSEYRKNNGALNVTALAKALRIHQPTLTRMLNGQSKEPASENAVKLCRFFSVDRDQLLGNKPIPDLDDGKVSNKSMSYNENFDNNVIPYHSHVRKIPLISFVQAGSWGDVENPYELNDAEDWISWPLKSSKYAYAVRNSGLSMFNPRTGEGYPDGCILKMEPEDIKPAVNGSDVIVRTPDGKVTFKQLQIDGGEKYLQAINPDWPERIIKIPEDSVICGVCDGYFMRSGK